MDFRSSNSVLICAVLIGSGGCAFFAPAACGGDRIDFSAPAIPLSIPKPEAQIKEPAKIIGSSDFSGGGAVGIEMPAPTQYYIVKPKTRDRNDWGLKDAWDLHSRVGDDSNQNPRDGDDWSIAPADATHSTNNNSLNTRPGSNPNAATSLLQQKYDSGLDGGPNASKFGAPNGLFGNDSRFGGQNGSGSENSRFGSMNYLERENSGFNSKNGSERDYSRFDEKSDAAKVYERSSDRIGRGFSGADDHSFWTKAFRHDAAGTDRFNPMPGLPLMNDPAASSGGVFEDQKNSPGLGPDSSRAAPLSPDWAGFTAPDDSPSRQFGDQAVENHGSLPAWEPAASLGIPGRNFSHQEQINASRVVAPNRPAILSMPKRPGDPH